MFYVQIEILNSRIFKKIGKQNKKIIYFLVIEIKIRKN